MEINRANIAKLHEELDIVLKAFAEKHGLVASKTRLRFSATNFEVRDLQFQTKDSNPAAIDPRYLADLKRNGLMVGLDSSMIGTELVLPAKRGQSPKYEFLGMRASKAVCKNLGDGKPYLWDANFIAAQIKLVRSKA